MGDIAALCRGHVGTAGLSAEVAAACKAGAAEGLRMALLLCCSMLGIGGLFMIAAARFARIGAAELPQVAT